MVEDVLRGLGSGEGGGGCVHRLCLGKAKCCSDAIDLCVCDCCAGDYVVIERIMEGQKVQAEIVKILYQDQIKELKRQSLWYALYRVSITTASVHHSHSLSLSLSLFLLLLLHSEGLNSS